MPQPPPVQNIISRQPRDGQQAWRGEPSPARFQKAAAAVRAWATAAAVLALALSPPEP